jgi:hypothetical protein
LSHVKDDLDIVINEEKTIHIIEYNQLNHDYALISIHEQSPKINWL